MGESMNIVWIRETRRLDLTRPSVVCYPKWFTMEKILRRLGFDNSPRNRLVQFCDLKDIVGLWIRNLIFTTFPSRPKYQSFGWESDPSDSSYLNMYLQVHSDSWSVCSNEILRTAVSVILHSIQTIRPRFEHRETRPLVRFAKRVHDPSDTLMAPRPIQ